MKFPLLRVISVALLVLTKTSSSRPLTARELADLEEFARSSKLWKNTIKGLEMMKEVTNLESQKKGEAVPEDMVEEFKVLLKVMFIFTTGLKKSFRRHLEEATSSEIPEKFRKWRRNLVDTIDRVEKNVHEIALNLQIKKFNPASLEEVGQHLDEIWSKNMGLTVLLKNCSTPYEDRFFEMVNQFIRNKPNEGRGYLY